MEFDKPALSALQWAGFKADIPAPVPVFKGRADLEPAFFHFIADPIFPD